MQLQLKEPLLKALKGKKDLLSGIIESICDTCVDNYTGAFESRASTMTEKMRKKVSCL